MSDIGIVKTAGNKLSLAKEKLAECRKKKPSKKAIIISAVALVLVVCIVLFAFGRGGNEKVSAQSAFVTKGAVTKVIEGSGTIEAVDQYEITALVKGEILKDHFEEGQEVKEGDLLYEIDTADIENNIEKSKASLEKSQLSYEQSVETVSNLTVRSTISGTVQEVYIKNGDNISNNGKIADVINSDYMRLKINFNYSDARNMYAGQSATVYLESSSGAIVGEVESVSTGSLINSSGAPVSPVEIVVKNPGAIKSGDTATAIVGNYACNDAGTFEYYETASILAKSSGEAYNLRIKAGDKVTKGDAVVYLSSSSARVNARQSELSLKDSRLALENLVDERDEYNITAPISGKIIQKNSKAGDKLDNSNSNTVMAIIADLSSLIFEISVDELDISNIEEGQTVTVTADALEGQTFTGHVENVSIVGSSQNGVTSYPVKVVMDDGLDSGLIPGMNVNASIVIDSREDVLRIPISAVNRGNIVYVKSDSDTAKNSKKQSSQTTANENMPDEKTDRGSDSRHQPQGDRGDKPDGKNFSEEDTRERSKPDTANNNKSSSEPRGNLKGNNLGQRLLENMQKNAPEGYTAVIVETGLSDDSFTEIISGLAEGDEVYIPDTTSSSERNQMGGMPSGMPGGMDGGMPGGGMPSGMPNGGGGMRNGGNR